MEQTNPLLSTHAAVYRRASSDALGFPAVMLLASMTGFGSLAKESGLSLGMALTSTAGIWGLPGQVALAEMHAAGVSALFVILAVSMANARFLPMAVSFIPLMRSGVKRFGWMFALVQMLSINSWAAGIRSFPGIAVHLRVHYYVLFAAICMSAGLVGTAVGYYGVGAMPPAAALGLIFLNPLFFAVLLAGTRMRAAVIAMLVGIPLGPILHAISPDWGLPATGIVGGSLAFWIHRKSRNRTRNGG